MPKFSSIISGNRGVAIVAVTMVMVVVALLGGAIISQTNQDTQLSNRALTEKQAVYIAESSKERGYAEIMNDPDFATAGNPGIINGVNIQGGVYDLMVTELNPDPKVIRITANGTTDSGDTRQIITVAEVLAENVFVWNNAIFGGDGQVGGVINGNCAIHGSVHLLGDMVGSGSSSIEALDLSGASLIHNNYVGIPAALEALIPGLPTTVFGGETIESLEAKLRVKNGAVGVSGASEIGEANIVGNGIKETMDGIYIETDDAETRWTGNQVVDGVPNPGTVQSDNGTDALYDLGDAVQMPGLGDPYGGYASYGAYFDDNSLHLPDGLVLDDSNSAMLIIQGHAFPPGVTVAISGDAFKVTDATGTNTIAYDFGTGVLAIDGMVQVDGNLVVGEKNFDIDYTGKGTIYAAGDGSDGSGDIDIHSDLLPATIFPTVDVLGLMAKDDIALADGPGDSQLMMAGAFYAVNDIVSTKQNEIAGTFVCNNFDMGTNVPKIYQVPSLADNLPPGMIGSDPIWVVTGFDEKSWQIEID